MAHANAACEQVNVLDDGLLNVRQVAQLLGIGTRTVWRWTVSGELPAPVRLGKTGRVVRWGRAELLAWVEEKWPCRKRLQARIRTGGRHGESRQP